MHGISLLHAVVHPLVGYGMGVVALPYLFLCLSYRLVPLKQ